MGLGFLVPAFLAGLAALAIPILMHLRDKNEETPTRFPSLMFLVRLPIRTSDRRKVTDWPLLLLRALAVAILVLAFSRPFFGREATASEDRRARSVVLLLDRSMSMGYRGTWEAALDSTRAVLAGLASQDQASLILFDEEAEVALRWTGDQGALRAAVEAARPVPRGTRFGAALRVARSTLVGAPHGAPEIIVVTDLQRSGLTGVAGLELPAGLPVRVIGVAPGVRANTSVRAVEARRVVDGPRVQLQVMARVVTRELPAPRPARLTLRLGGREVGVRSATLPRSGDLAVVFDAIPAPVAAVAGVVTVDADALPGDDTLHFALPADDALVVLAVVPDDLARDETLFLERALAIGRAPAVRVERRRVGTLEASSLARASMVLFWDVIPPAAGTAATVLETFVRDGRGYAVYVGPRLGGRRLSSVAGATAVTGMADRRVGGGALLGELRTEHPLFAPFRTTQGALLAPRFYRYPRLEPAVGAEVLARFDDGAAAILERTLGEGRVLVVGLGLDTRGSDLPLQPAFLPFVRRLVLHTSGHEAAPLWRYTGESWMPRSARRDPVVLAPDGALLRPEPGESSGIALTLARPGVYAAYEGRVDGTPRVQVAVNVVSAESELTSADPRELLLGVGESTDSTLQGVTAPTSSEVESKQRAWRILLLAALLLLAVETVIASRGWRGKARRATIVASDGAKG